MKDIKVTDSVKYIGVDDHDIDLFESQYVVPNGVSYNSYVILDEKVAVMDLSLIHISRQEHLQDQNVLRNTTSY